MYSNETARFQLGLGLWAGKKDLYFSRSPEKRNAYYLRNRERLMAKSKANYEKIKVQNPEGLKRRRKRYDEKLKASGFRRIRVFSESQKEVKRNRYHEWIKNNPNGNKERYQNRKVQVAEYRKVSKLSPEKMVKKKARDAQYYVKNRKKIIKQILAYKAKRRKNDPAYAIEEKCRGRIFCGLKRQKNTKNERSVELIGCSWKYLKEHLESQFLPGMSWENNTPLGWHIDHKIPCASFDLSIPEQRFKCFHFTNLQPLWAKANLSKGAKILA